MPIRVLVSPDPTAPFDNSWELVGTLETGLATINQRAAKALQKNPSGSASLGAEFYLSGDPSSRWVKAESEHERFGIAFDLLGDGTRIFVGNKPATVAPLGTRKPEPHPGSIVQPVLLGIKVSGGVVRV